MKRSWIHRNMRWTGRYSNKDQFRAPDGTTWMVEGTGSLDDAQRSAYDQWERWKKKRG